MMKKHRASWARTAGGAGAVGLLGMSAMIVATPGFAHEEPAPANVVMATQDREPIIAPSEMARLREKCGRKEKARGAIVCSDEEARDPEVRAIVDKTMTRAKARVERTMPSKKEFARLRKEVGRAAREAAAVDVDLEMTHAHEAMEQAQAAMAQRREHMEHAERAMALAHVQLARIDAEKIRHDALRAVHAPMRVHVLRANLSPEDMAELRADMEELKKELSEMDLELEAEMREMREELERELAALRHQS